MTTSWKSWPSPEHHDQPDRVHHDQTLNIITKPWASWPSPEHHESNVPFTFCFEARRPFFILFTNFLKKFIESLGKMERFNISYIGVRNGNRTTEKKINKCREWVTMDWPASTDMSTGKTLYPRLRGNHGWEGRKVVRARKGEGLP